MVFITIVTGDNLPRWMTHGREQWMPWTLIHHPLCREGGQIAAAAPDPTEALRER